MHLILVSFNKKIAIRRTLETVEGRGGRCAILPSVPSSKYPPSVSPPLSLLCVHIFIQHRSRATHPPGSEHTKGAFPAIMKQHLIRRLFLPGPKSSPIGKTSLHFQLVMALGWPVSSGALCSPGPAAALPWVFPLLFASRFSITQANNRARTPCWCRTGLCPERRLSFSSVWDLKDDLGSPRWERILLCNFVFIVCFKFSARPSLHTPRGGAGLAGDGLRR